jgi:regulator of sirC expression with transglutaminase-like and TPR domain
MVNNELRALVSLLDEPNESNFLHIQERILKYGADVIPVLEDVWENSFDELIQHRVENIIHTINFIQIKEDLYDCITNTPTDLLRAYFLISKFQYPELNYDIIYNLFNEIRKDLWLEISPNLTALEQIKVLNHVFFEIHQIKSNKNSSKSFNLLFLNNLLNSKTGTPLSLGLLFLILAQSVHLPIFAVDIPQNLILCFSKGFSKIEKSDILFYINPFNKGIIFTYKEIDMFVKQSELEKSEKYYRPIQNAEILILLLNALKSKYLKDVDNMRVVEINELIELLENAIDTE